MNKVYRFKPVSCLVLFALLWVLAACGPTSEEYQAQVQQTEDYRNISEQRLVRIQELEDQLVQQQQQHESETIQMQRQQQETLLELQERSARLEMELEQKEEVLAEKKVVEPEKYAEITSSLENLQQKAEQVDELQRALEIERQLNEELREEINEGKVRISNMTDVQLEDRLLFGSGQAFIKANGFPVLRKVGSVLKRIEDKHIQVVGHTDNQPIGPSLRHKFPTKWELSASRAISVVRYLVDKVGVPENRISAAAFGDSQPVASNDTAEGRQLNRRVEFKLIPLRSNP